MPNLGFLVLIAGVLLVYCEFVWVGKIVFGTAGALLALAGIALILRLPHTTPALALVVAAVACFAIETLVQTYFTAAALATALLACGFWKLGVAPQLAFPASIMFGIITAWLLATARKARCNKRMA